MSLETLYNTIACMSPRVEIMLRRIYWNNIKTLRRLKPQFSNTKPVKNAVDFNKILKCLENNGIKKGSLLIVHSSYDTLEGTGLSADDIIDALLGLIGKEGTLVMPVTRIYKEVERSGKSFLDRDTDNIVCTYNVHKGINHTGLLPYLLMHRPDSVKSRHPLSSAAAIGPLAEQMMAHNLEGDKPASHGPNSSWKYCLDHNAMVVGLGVDLVHYLTIMHVVEDAFSDWPVKDWYRERKFKIVDRDFTQEVIVKERKPEWGTLYLADRNLKKDLLQEHILHIENIDKIAVSFLDAQTYIAYIQKVNKKKKGYPYLIPKKYLTC